MAIHVLVTVYPQPDKTTRVEELVKWVAGEVKNSEPAVSDYRSYTNHMKAEQGPVFMIFFQQVKHIQKW